MFFRSPEKLDRLLNPKRIAVVGISENSRTAACMLPSFRSSAEIFFVNPTYPKVFGHETVGSLDDIGAPIDAVMSYMSAQRTVALIEDAAEYDVGGYILVSSGYAEIGGVGAELQDRLANAAISQGAHVIGPNGIGYLDVHRGLNLTIASPYPHRVGGISLVSQSGACLSAAALAVGKHRGIGLHRLISAGNEAATDLADYVAFLAHDEGTAAIGLVVEEIRRPEEFFEAVRLAAEASKPVVALKLGRTERARRIAQSHTAALAGDAFVYDIAFKQAGAGISRDFDELADRLQLFEQLPHSRWNEVNGLAFLTQTGGLAQLVADLAAEESLPVPDLEGELAEWVRANVPGGSVANPLDPTGLAQVTWPEIMDRYSESDELDTYMMSLPLGADDEAVLSSVISEFCRGSKESGKTFVLSSLTAPPDVWVDRFCAEGDVALGNGIRSSLRGIATLGAFVRHRSRRIARPPVAPELPPPNEPFVEVREGRMLPFDRAFELLSDHGLRVAPSIVLSGEEPLGALPFPGPYAVKLADVAHRTEIVGVRLGLASQQVADAVNELRSLAGCLRLGNRVAVQQMVESHGEAFIGLRGSSELGPVVTVGLGGILVQLRGAIAGRIAPIDGAEALELVNELTHTGVFNGLRGDRPWDREQLAQAVEAASTLVTAGRRWIESLDINPLIFDGEGFVVVDAVCLVADSPRPLRGDGQPQ